VVFCARSTPQSFTTVRSSLHPKIKQEKLIDQPVTYDITWTAYSGWVWTTLEAQLAVICASVPSLKVFFIRYFGTDTTRAGYSQTGTPSKSFGPSSKTRSVGFDAKISQHSAQRSQCTAGSIRDDVPLEGIHINHKLDVKVEERDDCSQVSFASTKALTALPMPTQPGQSARRSVLVAEARQGVAAGLVRVTSRLAAHSEHDLDAQQSHTRYDK
jgi:hypothetical protein